MERFLFLLTSHPTLQITRLINYESSMCLEIGSHNLFRFHRPKNPTIFGRFSIATSGAYARNPLKQ